MMGGGNTFRLLDSLYGLDVVERLRRHVRERADPVHGRVGGHQRGLPDDPHDQRHADLPAAHVSTRSGLVPFQINLHYLDADPDSTYMGETRDTRIEEFLEENDCPVLAMYEGSWLRVSAAHAEVTGPAQAVPARGCDSFATGPMCRLS